MARVFVVDTWQRYFDPADMIDVDLSALKFDIMNELFATGDAYLAELKGLRAKGRAATVAASSSAPFEKRRKKKGSTIKDRDPW